MTSVGFDREAGETQNPPAMRVRDSGYTNKTAFLLQWKSSSYHVRKAVSWLNKQTV